MGEKEELRGEGGWGWGEERGEGRENMKLERKSESEDERQEEGMSERGRGERREAEEKRNFQPTPQKNLKNARKVDKMGKGCENGSKEKRQEMTNMRTSVLIPRR